MQSRSLLSWQHVEWSHSVAGRLLRLELAEATSVLPPLKAHVLVSAHAEAVGNRWLSMGSLSLLLPVCFDQQLFSMLAPTEINFQEALKQVAFM